MLGLFLFPTDTIDEVKKIRNRAREAMLNGQTIEWTSTNTTNKKIYNVDLALLITEANLYLRTYDPDTRSKNPIRDRTRPFIR